MVTQLCGKMMRRMLLAVSLFAFLQCQSPQSTSAPADSIPVLATFDELEQRLKSGGDTTFVVNFWATTCPPCRKEMPLLEAFNAEKGETPHKVLLVSLDRLADVETRVRDYVQSAGLKSEVFLLADPQWNVWTGKVDTSWYGALPATWVVRADAKAFQFGAFERIEDIKSLAQKVR